MPYTFSELLKYTVGHSTDGSDGDCSTIQVSLVTPISEHPISKFINQTNLWLQKQTNKTTDPKHQITLGHIGTRLDGL